MSAPTQFTQDLYSNQVRSFWVSSGRRVRQEITLDIVNRENGTSVVNVLYDGVPRESFPCEKHLSIPEALHLVAVSLRLQASDSLTCKE